MILDVLSSPEVLSINFSAYGTSIKGSDFYETFVEMVFGTRNVTVSPEFSNGAAATYHPDTNVIKVGLKSGIQFLWESYVVHEVVHAIIDRKKLQIPALENEALAYIAQMIYLQKLNRVQFSDAIYMTAARLAGLIANGSSPSTVDLEVFKAKILINPAYFGRTPSIYLADG